MRTFMPTRKPGHQTNPADSIAPVRSAAKNSASSPVRHLQHSAGNLEAQPSSRAAYDVRGANAASATIGFGHDFSRVPAHAHHTDAPSGHINWPAPLRGDLERAFQVSLESVPLTADSGLARHDAAAAVDGVGIRVDPRWLNPESKGGRHLIAHELAHLVRESHDGNGAGASEREADALADRFIRGQGPLLRPTTLQQRPAPMRFKTAVEAAKDAIRLATEGLGTDEDAIMKALRSLTPAQMAELAADPAIMALLVGDLSGAELATASALLATGRVGSMSRKDLAAIAADPSKQTLGVVAAAKARDMLLEHKEAVTATGTGTIQGNKCGAPLPSGATSSDCTTYVLDVLKSAFNAKGQGATWTKVMATASAASGGSLKGTEVLKALQSEADWEGVFWSPDPRNPQDKSSEHPVAYKTVVAKGTYYGVNVDASKSVTNYRRTDPAATQDLSGIEKLRRLQFGVIAMRGGLHMALLVNGSVYEIHWDKPATDPDAIQATPLETFAWQSGVIVAPKGDLARAWEAP